MTFSPEQLNFFKFSTVVLDEFPVALRQVFVFMWDNLVAGAPKWDDSVAVRNLFLAKEGGKTKYVPTGKSIKEWDCTALFEATIFAKTFSKPDGTGKRRTLKELYAKSLPGGTFHHAVISSTGNQAEMYALALDQLRLLRNTLCHQISTREIDKVTFDNYIILTKDVFTAFGRNTTRIDEIGKLAEEDFPTARLQQVEDELKKEKDAAIKFQQIEDHLKKVESQVKDVGSDVKDVKTGVTDVKTQVQDVGSDVKNVKTGVTDIKTQVEDVGSDVKEVKTEVTDVKMQVEDVGSDVKDVKTWVTDVKSQVEDVGLDMKDVKTQVEDVESDVKDVKTEVTDVKRQVEDVGSDMTGVKTQVEDVGSDVKDVKTGVTDVKTQVEDVWSDVKELKAGVDHIKQAMQAESSKGPLAPDSCIPQKIPHFVGRKQESLFIRHHLTNDSTRLVGIWGPPGFGKTSVAIDVAHDLRAMEIPVYFISLRGMKRKDDLVSKLLSIFTVTEQVTHPQISASDWLIQCLQQLQNRFVLILDNVDDLLESGDAKLKDEVLRFVEEIVTRSNHIKLLFTTRCSPDYLSHKLPLYLERVGVLDTVASGRLVRLLLPDLSDDDYKSIVKVCEHVPLAIRLMCSTMIGGNVSLHELLEEIKITPLVDVLDNESFPDDVRLKSIINTSFQRLTTDEKDAFVSLAVFPGSFGVDEATAILNFKTAFRTKKMLQSLERKSLITSNDIASISYTIHSLLLSFIDEKRMEDEEIEAAFKVAERWLYDYNISIFREANDKFLTGHSNEALKVLLGHHETIISSLVNGTRAEELHSKVVEVLSKAELLLHFLLSDDESLFEKIYDTAIKEAKKRQNLVDERRLLAAKSFRHWAWFTTDHQTWKHSLQSAGCSSTADFPAKMLCYHGVYQLLCGKVDEGVSSLRSSIDRLGSCCDEDVLRILSYKVLAGIYHGKEEHEMASHFQNLFSCEAKTTSRFLELEISEDGLFADDIKEYSTRTTANGTFFFLTAKLLSYLDRNRPLQDTFFNSANKVLTTVLAKRYTCSADISPLIKESLRMITSLIEADANVELEALVGFRKLFHEPFDQLLSEDSLENVEVFPSTKLFDSILTYFEAIFGPRWFTFFDTADFKSLIELFRDTLELLKSINHNAAIQGEHHNRSPGVDFEDLARSYDKIGVSQRRIGDYNEAIKSHQQAITEREKSHGDHVDTVFSLTNIGCVHFKMNNEIEAAKSFRSALELRKKLGVYDHEDTADIYHTLGENYLTLGNYEKALEAHLQALELQRKHLGDHPKTAESLNGVGTVYYKMGEHQSARETFHNVVDVTRKMLGKHEQTASSCYNLALNYLAMGSYPEALEFCQQALSMRLELSDKPMDEVASFYTLGRISFKMGDKESAIEAFQKGTKTPLLFRGGELTARCFHWLGKVQYSLGDLNGALESLQKATQRRKKMLGNHPDTTKSQRLLNCVSEALSGKGLHVD